MRTSRTCGARSTVTRSKRHAFGPFSELATDSGHAMKPRSLRQRLVMTMALAVVAVLHVGDRREPWILELPELSNLSD